MKKYLFLTSALVAFTMSGVTEAACIQTPTCSSLGYTSSSSCDGGIKCPFGNAWNCTVVDLTNKITEITNKITTIEEKITEIEENGGGSGGTNPAIGDCVVGAILNSDKTCSSEIISSKTPIGVVFHAERRLAIGLENMQIGWSDLFDIPGLTNWSETALTEDWGGKENTKIVWEYCQSKGKDCLAFEYVSTYKREGTSAGDWYLPALAELQAIYENRGVLNKTLVKIGGTELPTLSYHWSSSQRSSDYAWHLRFKDGDVEYCLKYNAYNNIRPVLAF